MVLIDIVRGSNALIKSSLPPGLVAVFVGGTSGIGEITLKTLVKYTDKPRIYIVGRNRANAERIVEEAQTICPLGEFRIVKQDISLIKNVDKVCADIKEREKSINLLFLTTGTSNLDRTKTSEGLHILPALNWYARIRFIINLLPLLQNAPSLRRIVSVGAGSLEGKVYEDDLQGFKIPVLDLRGHFGSLITLSLEELSKTAPEVSIVHDWPGSVKTPLLAGAPEEMLKQMELVSHDECGERHVFLSTSARYPPPDGESTGVPLGDQLEVSVGSNGRKGSGVYSVGKTCEVGAAETLELLADLRGQGMNETTMQHVENEFRRIMGF